MQRRFFRLTSCVGATVISMVSGYLNSIQAKYEIGGVLMSARLWTVVLASSDAGKTFTTSMIANWLGSQHT